MIEMMETMSAEAFSARLREEIRARFGANREGWFADRIGMGRTHLSRVLNNPNYRPEMETVRRYADGLGIDPAEVARWIPGYILPDDATGEPSVPLAEADSFALTLAEIEAMTDAEVVAFVEALPGRRHHRMMAEERADRSPASYVGFCRGILVAWASNREAALQAARSARE